VCPVTGLWDMEMMDVGAWVAPLVSRGMGRALVSFGPYGISCIYNYSLEDNDWSCCYISRSKAFKVS